MTNLRSLYYRRMLCLFGLLLLSVCHARAEDPCASTKHRALVLSGGGPKGAFETGAVYHLVLHRNCNFNEFSGTSVGALNAVFLAQAAESADAVESHANLAAQSEALVSLWQSVKSPRDIMKGRPLAMLRFGLFGLENLNDFQPLRRLMEANISLEKLAKGRPVRAGVVSFWDGGYREVLAKPMLSKDGAPGFLDYLYASSVPPVYGKMPRIPKTAPAEDSKLWAQFTDGSLRHITPVAGYFAACNLSASPAGSTAHVDGSHEGSCSSHSASLLPIHELVQQLFVIVTSPFSRDSDLLPMTYPICCERGSRQMTDGRKIMGRTLALMDDASYRWDLDFLLSANDILRWRWQVYHNLVLSTPADQVAEAKRQFRGGTALAVESYNPDPQDPDAPSLPYDIGLVVPEKEYAEIAHLLTAFSPPGIQEQLYCGCMAADHMMQKDFELPSLADRCAERFPPLLATGKASKQVGTTKWEAMTCQATTEQKLDAQKAAN